MKIVFDNMTTIIRVVEASLIASFIYRVLSYSGSFSFMEVLYEMAITFACFVLTGRRSEVTYNLLASGSLFYLCIPSFAAKYRIISLFYCIKYFHLRHVLKDLSITISTWEWLPHLKYIRFAFDFVRYSTLEYLFLGLTITGYKLYAAKDAETLPEDYQLWYQLLVTSSTIGYGDVTPRSRNQMIYFTAMIPVMCGSFVIYLNHLAEAHSNAFLSSTSYLQQTPTEEPIQIIRTQLKNDKVSVDHIRHYTQYINKKPLKHKSQQQLLLTLQSLTVPNDPNILIAINLKRYNAFLQKLFPEKLSSNEGLRRCIALNIKENYVPRNTVIIGKNQCNPCAFYVAEGTVKGENESQQESRAVVINQKGFYSGQTSNKSYRTTAFSVIWTVDSRPIKEHFPSMF